MAGGEDEAVAVRPVGVRRVRPADVAVEDVGHGSERHRGPRMARVRLLDRVHRERANRLDRAAARPFSCLSPRHCNHTHMAVLIASRLRKEIAGDALFDGVSFKVERRDRLALAGPNGAGKTTLLRMLMGETRSTAASSPSRRERGSPYTTSALPSSAGSRSASTSSTAPVTSSRPRRSWPARVRDGRRRSRRRHALRLLGGAGQARARGRLRLARPRDLGRARPRLLGRRLRPQPADVLRRRADARFSCARACRRPRPAPPRRADEPPRRDEHRVARARASRSTRPSSSSRTTAGSWRRSRTRRSSSRPGRATISRARGTRGGGRRPSAPPTPRRPPSGSRSTSTASSGSLRASGTRSRKPSRHRRS